MAVAKPYSFIHWVTSHQLYINSWDSTSKLQVLPTSSVLVIMYGDMRLLRQHQVDPFYCYCCIYVRSHMRIFQPFLSLYRMLAVFYVLYSEASRAFLVLIYISSSTPRCDLLGILEVLSKVCFSCVSSLNLFLCRVVFLVSLVIYLRFNIHGLCFF